MGATFIVIGTAIMAIFMAGYFAQHYLPPPTPKIVGIDLGTTYSCVGVYHAVTGRVDVLEVQDGHQCIPSVVAFTDHGVLVGYKAVAQAEHNPKNTIYDAKRFIGKVVTEEELAQAQKRYPFKIQADKNGLAQFVLSVNNTELRLRPEDIGSVIVNKLKLAAEANLSAPVTKVVMSVPAEFNALQRNYTRKAASLTGLEVFRVINEPTAAALAYGLHTKPSLQNVMVVDLGGGTLDVSLLNVQGGMFLTQAMAGNNHLGGQDFNLRLFNHILEDIAKQYNQQLTHREDLQSVRMNVENVKISLTSMTSTQVAIPLKSFGQDVVYRATMTRSEFERLNQDLFSKVLVPIKTVLKTIELPKDEVDEIVLVGGSTRIPKVRELIRDFFGKDPNTSIDPELAVAMGVSVQAGIIGGMWPLKVSAVELPTSVKKIQIS
ncbi:heat shock 70 kDa protein 13-like [Mizuhopecten yessoensis]|uniref:Heat shock 70 kDa protein 13 n=1 Tax=Mizuhopecten yessoensis TaxID=6573 RepID=A0A1C9U322_MIZYE|nr:heat shock 70 kDa protein 13-like [Mizuhopecten yessoensis]AOR17381.1 heat shock 70 kDa protein [Mizuhopecten yessoensis]OWF38303.1 Heat shock 70 kDa protein 13 [Mizuhopecten yessoensis]